jgi:hypothetical protein
MSDFETVTLGKGPFQHEGLVYSFGRIKYFTLFPNVSGLGRISEGTELEYRVKLKTSDGATLSRSITVYTRHGF